MAKPNPIPPILTEQDIRRFWFHVNKVPGQGPKGECWEWKYWRYGGSQSKLKSYHPVFSAGGRHFKASRVAFFLTTGKWPTLLICHTCDNPPCVRTLHFFEGTHAQNMADMVRKGRHPSIHHANWHENLTAGTRKSIKHRLEHQPQTVLRGTQHGGCKLQDSDVRVIRLLCGSGEFSQRAIATCFGVEDQLVSAIMRGLAWASVVDIDPSELVDDTERVRRLLKAHANACAIGNRHGSKTHPETIARGSQRSLAKLREADIPVIRALWNDTDLSQSQIATRFGVSQTAISQVVQRRTWTHIP